MPPSARVLIGKEIGVAIGMMIAGRPRSFLVATWNLDSVDKGPLAPLFRPRQRKPKSTTIIVNMANGEPHVEVKSLELLWHQPDVTLLKHRTSHAKLYITDDEVVVGSANLSDAGMRGRSRDVAIWSRDKAIVADVHKAFEELEKDARPVLRRDLSAIRTYERALDKLPKDQLPSMPVFWPRRGSTGTHGQPMTEKQLAQRQVFLKRCDPPGPRRVFTAILDELEHAFGADAVYFGRKLWTLGMPKEGGGRVKVLEGSPTRGTEVGKRARQTLYVCFQTIPGSETAPLATLRKRLLDEYNFEAVPNSSSVKWKVQRSSNPDGLLEVLVEIGEEVRQ